MAYRDGTAWTFQSGRFLVCLTVTPDYGYQYDGDDEDGEVQSKLDSGEYVAFDSKVEVIDGHGVVIGRDDLGGSVYAYDDVSDFWTSHRTSAPEYRNTIAQKASGVCIGHYFPDMVKSATREARAYLLDAKSKYVRGVAA